MIWILLAILAVLGGAYIGVRRRQRAQLPARASAAAALLERTIKDVRPNDIIQHAGRDYLVEGVVSYDEDGHSWKGARMADSGQVRWMIVGLERGSALTVRLLDVAKDVELSGYPPETLDVGGTSYKLAGRGTATATFAGDLEGLATPEGGTARCRWWKYTAPGELSLVVEQWGEIYRTLRGETVRADDVELLGAT